MSPYQEALSWIETHHGTNASVCLAKLLLSICSRSNHYGLRECLEGLDDHRTALALRTVMHFARMGPDDELVAVGRALSNLYPELCAIKSEIVHAVPSHGEPIDIVSAVGRSDASLIVEALRSLLRERLAAEAVVRTVASTQKRPGRIDEAAFGCEEVLVLLRRLGEQI